MDRLSYWKRKVFLTLHDPPGKPFYLKRGTGGHLKRASEVLEAILGMRFDQAGPGGRAWYYKQADWAASGADRPVLDRPRGSEGGKLVLDFAKAPIITHPLERGSSIRLPLPGEAESTRKALREVWEAAIERLSGGLSEAFGPDGDEEDRLPEPLVNADDPEQIERLWWWLWRSAREEHVRGGPEEAPTVNHVLWDHMPGESRAPDHAIWEHLRVTSALAFLGRSDPARHPFFMAMSVGPVGAFIRQARTTRDLWMGSFLLSELTFAAMQPFFERYGADCILYPDLRRNVRMDRWLVTERPLAMAFGENPDPATFAALIPDTFVALVPQGGAGHLESLRELGDEARSRMNERWGGLTDLVKQWLEGLDAKLARSPGFDELWEAQIETGPTLSWTACPWALAQPKKTLTGEAVQALGELDALPGQTPSTKPGAAAARKALDAREARLGLWMDRASWSRYQRARRVFLRTNATFVQSERGFDYAIAHHNLRARHAQRRMARGWADVPAGGGEKCTVCGERSALGTDPASRAPIDQQRTEVRRLWSERPLDPEETGADRLCAICATKRYLIEASSAVEDQDASRGLGPVLYGRRWQKQLGDDGRLRVPFPSTSTVALQEYQAWAAVAPDAAGPRHELVAALAARDTMRTTFPQVLPALRYAVLGVTDAAGRELLKYDAQYLVPHTYDALIGRAKSKTELADLEVARKAARRLGAAARKAGKAKKAPAMDTRIAVVAIDGDAMGRLLLGDADRIPARWRDILHPDVVADIDGYLKNGQRPAGRASLEWMRDAGWVGLLDTSRLMGPSLHAFISRCLAMYANVVVPWVVEREFSGRLIYAGGDDVLAIVPGREAIPLAARLQQLYAAPWVADTEPDADPWAWRRRDWVPPRVPDPLDLGRTPRDEARRRFRVPQAPTGEQPLTLPFETHAPHAASGEPPPAPGANDPFRLIPMLGSGQGLSAGIAMGHYKTPLGRLVAEAERLMKDEAKGRLGGAAFATSLYSRSGLKLTFALPWRVAARTDAEGGHRLVDDVVRGFRTVLPGRLPYKLREMTPAALAWSDGNDSDESSPLRQWTYLEALLSQAWSEAERHQHLARAVVTLWQAGLARDPDDGDHAVDGLLLCRNLAAAGGEE